MIDVSATFVDRTIASTAVRLEDAVLLGRRQPCVERQDLRVAQIAATECVGDVVDFPLAAEEHEHVAGALALEFADRIDHRSDLVPSITRIVLVVRAVRPVADLDRVRPSLDDEHGRGHAIGREVLGEAVGVDRRRRDDHLEVGPLRQQLLEVAEDEVDVEAAFVGLVDDERVVAAEHPVALQLVEQDAVGHHPQERPVADTIVEADGVPDGFTDRRADLVGDALGDRSGGDTAGLRVADHAVDTASGEQDRASGSWVLLPEPVSPATITT